MSEEITVTKDDGHGKSWLKSEKARLAGAVGVGAAATIGAALLVDAFTDDRLGKRSGKWAGGEVKVERKLFRAIREARVERDKADKAFKRSRKASKYQKANKAREEGLKHWKRHLAAMTELDEQLAKFEAKSVVVGKAAGVKAYSKGGRPSKVQTPETHPAKKAMKAKKEKDQFDRDLLKEFHKLTLELNRLQAEVAKAQVNQAAAEAVATVLQQQSPDTKTA